MQRVDSFPLVACWLRMNFGNLKKKVVAVGSGLLALVCGVVVTGDWLSGL